MGVNYNDNIIFSAMLPPFPVSEDFIEKYNTSQLSMWLDGRITYEEMYKNIKTCVSDYYEGE